AWLTEVLQNEGRVWLLVRQRPGPNVQGSSSTLYELSPRIGAVAPLNQVRIGADDVLLGRAPGRGRTVLSSTSLFVISRSPAAEARVRAIDLAAGELWSQGLSVRHDELYRVNMPQPALSDSAVALCYSLQQRKGAQALQTYLVLLDRATGL